MRALHLTFFVLLFSLASMAQTEPALITTRGSATVYTQPDEVRMSFSIITESDELADARNQNSESAKAAISYLQSVGVLRKHIQTQYLNVGPRYRDRHRIKENRYYEASQYINICITDISRYEEIMIGLVDLEVHNLSSPTFTSTKLREVKDQARRKAIIAAREKAEMLAAELGQSIGVAYQISEIQSRKNWWGQNQNAYANSMTPSQSQESDSEVGFAEGQLEVKAEIDVSFYLLEN